MATTSMQTSTAILVAMPPAARVSKYACIIFLFLWVIMRPAIAASTVDVEVTGIDDPLKENVLLFLTIEQEKSNEMLTDGRVQRLHQKADKDIRAALEPFGYYRPEIQKELTRVPEGQWRAVYKINSGPQIQIVQYDFKLTGAAKEDPKFLALLKDPPLKKGIALNHVIYKTFKSDLAKLAARLGYFNARFTTARVEVNLEEYTSRIILHFDSGIRYRFGKVTLYQEKLRDPFLRRYVPFKKGEYYSVARLVELQQALNDSGYFNLVEAQPLVDQINNGEVPIDVKLTARKRHRYTFGVGYGTDTGARGKLGWEMPRVNSRGHRFDSALRGSEIGESVELHYRVPVLNPRTDQIVYSAGYTTERTEDIDSAIYTLSTSLIHARGGWRETLSLTYQQETYDIGSENTQSSELLMPGSSWFRVWADKRIYPRRGVSVGLDVRGATDQVVSNTTFSQFGTRIKTVYALNSFGRVLLRGRAGTTVMDKFEHLPASVRYFAGGSESVRGFAYHSLGPKNDAGDVVGARYLLEGSAEYEQHLGEKWGIAVFYDVGNAIDQLTDPLENGVGFGFRWLSPVGPVRLDFASARSQPGNPWRIHINIGPDL